MIDYNETRGISKETLNELLQELNPDFIKKLPDTPQEILKFAKRRVNPYISENINETLAKQMLETRQTDKEYLLTLFKAMTITFINGQDPSQHPVAAVLVSQTGAGKTSLRELINPQNQVYVVINPDLYKKYRSDADKIREKDRTHFGALTGIDSYDHAANIRTYAMEKGYNILIEVAPSLQQGLIGVDEKELEEHKLELDKQNIFPKIDRLANIQEELEYSLEEYNELKNNSEIIDIAKEYLEKAYKNMKENVTPKFSKELSQTISNISDGKYKNMKITDNDIMVEVENGNYVSASLLSEGTINQLYFSLRMAILKEISNETLPIFLDESFVFFDKNRLINTINYLNSNHDNQIIIFSCTEREKDILDYLNIKYNLITL